MLNICIPIFIIPPIIPPVVGVVPHPINSIINMGIPRMRRKITNMIMRKLFINSSDILKSQ